MSINKGNWQPTVPIVIGVTGHRDLRSEDYSSLEEKVRSIFSELKGDYKDTPLILLSPLAEGADRLVAKVALNLGVRLIVPLPMPQEEYEKDFQTQESKAEFLNLLNQADRFFELPLVEGNALGEIREYGAGRDRQYEQVGFFILRNCQILIALWNGIDTNLVGGTSEIVNFKLKGEAEGFVSSGGGLTPVEDGPVYHIVTPRLNGSEIQGEAFTLKRLYPERWKDEDKAKEAYHRIFNHVDVYNQDVLRFSAKFSEEVSKSKSYVIPEEKSPILPLPLRTILDYYAHADALAIYFQRHTWRTMVMIFGIIPFAVLFFELYLGPIPSPPILFLYLGILFFVYITFRRAKKRSYQNKYLDYRALAEGMRVQLFWQLAGLRESAADHYLRKQQSELDWIRYAIRNWSIVVDKAMPELSKNTDRNECIKLVMEHWVEDQKKYFTKSTRRDNQKLSKVESLAKWIFLTGLFIVTPLALLNPLFHFLNDLAQQGLQILIGLCPAVAAAFSGYAYKMAFSAQVKQYQRMSTLFNQASKTLSNIITNENLVREVIKELGKEALAENGDWVLMHRERPIEVPKG